MKLVGVSGTNASGKDTVGHMLAERHNYLFVSMTDMLRDEARRRGLPVTREVLRTISAEWRRESGLGVLIDKSVAHFEQQDNQYNGLVVASLRNPGEVTRLHELGGKLVWVDANPRIRYERIQKNSQLRGRAEEDSKSFDEFLREEQAEMQHSGDEATLNMSAVKEQADLVLMNEGDNIEAFKDEAEAALSGSL